MSLQATALEITPGAVSSGTAIDLPAGFEAAEVASHALHRYSHKHLALTVTATAGSVASPVEATPGDGAALGTAVSVGTSAAPGASEDVNTSSVAAFSKVASTLTLASDGKSFTLNVATQAGDKILLVIYRKGDFPVAQ